MGDMFGRGFFLAIAVFIVAGIVGIGYSLYQIVLWIIKHVQFV